MIYRILFFIVAIVVTFLVRDNFFFWDTVQLGSKHAHYFFETNFQSFILPEEIDSGHLPAFGMYLALCWKLFGKTLAVSHFAMLPFLLGIIYFLEKIGEQIAEKKYAPLLVLLCLVDPVLSSQSILISPDIPLVCFFLMGLWCVLSFSNRLLLVLAIIGLGLSSMRGMALGLGLFFFSIISRNKKLSVTSFWKNLWPFIPGGLIALAFMLHHYSETGWIGYHENSTWAPSFERVDAKGFFKNLAVLTWRLVDFGRIFLWVAFLALGVFLFRKRGNPWPRKYSVRWKSLLLLLMVFLFTVLNQLPYKGLLAHRYLLPVFLCLNFLGFALLFNPNLSTSFSRKARKVVYAIVLLGFLTGNFWIYPNKISQGWDSTLAHLPWYDLEKEVELFLHENEIPREEVGTAFPNIGPRKFIALNDSETGFKEKDLSQDCFVLYSNVMNDFSDEEIDELEMNWEPIFESQKGGVVAIVYKNKKETSCGN